MNEAQKLYLKNNLPFFQKLTPIEQQMLFSGITMRTFSVNEVVFSEENDCAGLYLVQRGELRAYIISEAGRELTLFRLFEYDICLFSASCLLNGIDFDLWVEAKADTVVYLIPNAVFNELQKNITVLNYTNQLLSSRLNDIMFLLNNIIFSRFDQRLAGFLLEQAAIADGDVLKITHEEIANHIGSAREVVTRTLQHFQNENIVSLSRGQLNIIDYKKLKNIISK